MSQNTREQWRPIDGFPNYQVSNKGKVMNMMSGKVLKPGVYSNGYEFVILWNHGKSKQCLIHRLVADTFINNPNNLLQVNHKDECKTNNDVSNLEWVTASQNTRYSAHKRSCKINQLSLDGELVKVWKSFQEIKRELGFSQGNIVACCKGRYKKMYGYRWEYADGLNQQKHNRPVAALTMDGDLIAEYKSAAEASRCLKICRQSIRYCLNGTCKSTHGLRFIYIDD